MAIHSYHEVAVGGIPGVIRVRCSPAIIANKHIGADPVFRNTDRGQGFLNRLNHERRPREHIVCRRAFRNFFGENIGAYESPEFMTGFPQRLSLLHILIALILIRTTTPARLAH